VTLDNSTTIYFESLYAFKIALCVPSHLKKNQALNLVATIKLVLASLYSNLTEIEMDLPHILPGFEAFIVDYEHHYLCTGLVNG
jgi:hypothetical protein